MRRLAMPVALTTTLVLVAPFASAQTTTTTAGEFSVEPPTLLSLGFDWKIAGDDNRNASGQDKHSVLVDYDTFVNVTMPDKTDPQHLYKPDGLDFRLKPGSPAIDAGVELPSITDGFTGTAPDIGAYEVGRPDPHYGPRN